MKSKKKPELKGKPLFRFEHPYEEGFDTVPTTWTMTITTTGFSKAHTVKKRVAPTLGRQM